jgi:hypothetical protein
LWLKASRIEIMFTDIIDLCAKEIEASALPSGGFSEHPNCAYRPDSTAWAVMALSKSGKTAPFLRSARAALASSQGIDGSVPFPGVSTAFWPTQLAILAWNSDTEFDRAKNRALQFLLKTTGTHPRFNPKSVIGHNAAIKGWPWIEETHSFVEPTAVARLALETGGFGRHERFVDAVKMVMNRQLPHGGWNYGNTFVYGKELRPFVDTTGIALTAVAGHVGKEQVGLSLQYLRDAAPAVRTPLSLAWALSGLGAWGEFPVGGLGWIEETLEKQDKYGPYGTSLLSLLTLAYQCQGDFSRKG